MKERWYPLVEEYRKAVRAFLAGSPLPLYGLEPIRPHKKA